MTALRKIKGVLQLSAHAEQTQVSLTPLGFFLQNSFPEFLCLQQGRKSVDLEGQSLQSRLTEVEKR